ncbi:MAG: GumC family protein [Pseudolabrys sp.]
MFFRKSKPAESPVVVAAPAAAAPPSIHQGDPDIQGLGRALWRNKSRIVLFTIIAAAGAYVAVNAMTPRYRSEARILLEARENVFLRAEADKANDRPTLDPEAVTSQIQLVLSRDLAREVIKKNKLGDNPEFDPLKGGMSLSRTILVTLGLARNPADMSAEERTLESYYSHLNAYAVERSRVIAISFYSASPELAAQVANSIAEIYLAMQQQAKQQQTRAASGWLAGEIESMRKKVAESEGKIAEYRAKANLFVGSNNTSLPSQQLSEINSQISAARGQKADLEARARQLRDLLRSGATVDSSDIANSESMRRLSEQRVALRAQLAEQSSTLLDQHPRIKELKAQIGEIDRQIRTEGERLARQLESDAKVAGNRIETLTASLDQAKQVASQTNEQDVHLRELERESKAQRDLLESYLAKYREASARDNINAAPPEARIISRASPAIKPDFPKKVPIILIAAFAAFALSSGLVVTGALIVPAGEVAYAAAYQARPQAAVAPAAYRVAPSPPIAPTLPQAYAASRALAAGSSSIDRIADGIRQAGDWGRCVSVIGAAREVGTTYAAISLARALSGDASVVLVDLAFGAPNLSVISSDPQAPGLVELLGGTVSFGDVITTDQYSPVHVVATGQVVPGSIDLLASSELVSVIEALARSYDHVVIDAGSATETAIEYLLPLSTQIVLVTGSADAPTVQALQTRAASAGFGNISILTGGARAEAA